MYRMESLILASISVIQVIDITGGENKFAV